MRKLVLTLSAIVAISAAANAQPRFGLKAGANFANLKASGDGVSMTFDSKVGLNAGAFVSLPLSGNISIQPEAVLSMEGAKVEDEKIELTYINVPVLFQYNTSGFAIETGPQLGLLMSAKAAGEDFKDDMESINLSWAIGAGYRLPSGLGFNARYNLGLSNIAKTEDDDEGKLKSNVFQVGISFTFGGGASSKK